MEQRNKLLIQFPLLLCDVQIDGCPISFICHPSTHERKDISSRPEKVGWHRNFISVQSSSLHYTMALQPIGEPGYHVTTVPDTLLSCGSVRTATKTTKIWSHPYKSIHVFTTLP